MSDKHKILCIDDEQDIVDALYRLFRKDYEVFTATSGSEGLQLLKENKISVIISDQKMPEMSGVETLKKSIAIDPDCVRILLTGYTDIESVIESINSGEVYRYITKPWDPIDLVNTVNKSVEKYEIKSELKEKNRQLKQAFDELKTLDQVKTQFMFLINHELKTPLTVLTSYTDLLSETKLDDEQKMYIGKVQKSNDKLTLIIDESLNLLKAETNQLEVSKNSVVVDKVVTEVTKEFEPKLKDKKLTFNIQVEESLEVITDKNLLKDILSRLIDNAIKFADAETKIHIDFKQEGVKKEASVSNTGKEVKPETIAKILQPFNLDEEMMNHSKGLGMGLSLTRSYLKCLGSELNITCENKLFKATFQL